jgi:hypothetical protein
MAARETALPAAEPPAHLRPLAELPSLRLADPAQDVRGWEVRTIDGARLGVVSDLLADADRLVAEYLLIRQEPGGGEWTVAVSSLDLRDAYLTPGSGFDPIPLRYQSTVGLTVWTAAAVAIVGLLAWAFGLIG